jgi:hypothetical protein
MGRSFENVRQGVNGITDRWARSTRVFHDHILYLIVVGILTSEQNAAMENSWLWTILLVMTGAMKRIRKFGKIQRG